MPIILVVDDSLSDRVLIGQVLKNEPLDWIVDFAESAEEALVRLQVLAADAVVTDMMMPGMDGLALLEMMRNRYPGVPVILTTGLGSESLAVTALRRGAASYVPKAELASRLGETIKQVLQVAKSERDDERVIESVSNMQFQFQLDNDPRTIPPLISFIQQMARRIKLCSVEGCRELGVALDEALINAIYHGNLELPRGDLNEVRGRLRDGEAVEMVDQRRAESPYGDRRVFLEAALTPLQAEITIRDEGCGFDSREPAPTDRVGPTSSMGSESRRGLVLIRNLMDSVEFNETGNEIVMIKRRRSDPVDLPPLPM